MDEQGGNQQKPLRPASNKKLDIYNTYLKNEKKRNIPIHDLESDDKMKESEQEHPENVDAVKENDIKESDVDVEFGEMLGIINDLNKHIEALTKERDDLKEQLVRKAAELENVRRRSLREKQEMVDYANERLLFRLLELLDDINSAADASVQSKDYESLAKGLEMIRAKAVKLFEEAGVTRMDDGVGKDFDVNYHEALMMSPSEYSEGAVVQVIQPGYMLKEKVLRHAKVITSSGN